MQAPIVEYRPLVGESAHERSSDRRVNMSKASRYCFLLAIAACLLLAQPVTAAAEQGVRGNLVDVNWLAKNLKSPDVVILDASPETYAANHIPGALSVNI